MKSQMEVNLVNTLEEDKTDTGLEITTGTDNTTKKPFWKICKNISAEKKVKVDFRKIHWKLLLLLEKDYKCEICNDKQQKLNLNAY